MDIEKFRRANELNVLLEALDTRINKMKAMLSYKCDRAYIEQDGRKIVICGDMIEPILKFTLDKLLAEQSMLKNEFEEL